MTPLGAEDAAAGAPQPRHRVDWMGAGLVAVGGAVGTGGRHLIGLAVVAQGFPAATLTVNLLGAFLLGLLIESLTRRGRDRGALRRARLLLGTGALGGFTTYSTLALDVVTLASDSPSLAAVYGVGTVLAGALATAAGVAVAAAVGDRRRVQSARTDR